jgi:ferric-dicitrate binding protein FerR (iron transport regulator)
MKSPFSFVLTLSILAISPFALAAGKVSVTSVSGLARFTSDSGAPQPAKVGSSFDEGSGIETNVGSSAELSLGNGVKLTLEPSTRIRLRKLQVSPGIFVCEVILLRGSISGDAALVSQDSSFSIRTTSGVANVAGTQFGVSFTPDSPFSGKMNITSRQGDIVVLGMNSTAPLTVSPKADASLGARGAQITQRGVPFDLSSVPFQQTEMNAPTPAPDSAALRVNPNLAFISPYGAGQFN